jgi:tRNA(His) guanylyltransferase
MNHDSLGDRMKNSYEDRARFKLPRRTNTIIRLDGKAFHTYTHSRPKPWDETLHDSLIRAALALCRQAQGAVFGFVQSDEISILLTDYSTITTEAWFDGNIQKIASISSSIVTAEFNLHETWFGEEAEDPKRGLAHFDARVFSIPDPIEVHNYFVWRQKDIIRNSLSMLAQAHFSHNQLHGKGREALLEMLAERDISWDDMPEAFKYGTPIVKRESGWSWFPAHVFTLENSLVLDTISPS